MAEEKVRENAYSALSDRELYAMYRQSAWDSLGGNERLELLQETVNREAAKDGNRYSADVELEALPAGYDGYEEGGRIVLDYEKTVCGTQSDVIDGKKVSVPLNSPSYDALCTVLHEFRHVRQENLISGVINDEKCDVRALRANDTSLTVADGYPASTYLTGKTDYALYYLQPCEIDAYVTSEARTAEIIYELREEYGSDPAMESYMEKMSSEGYMARTEEYGARLGGRGAEREIAKALINASEETDYPVRDGVERAVRTEMRASAASLFAGYGALARGADPSGGGYTHSDILSLAEGYSASVCSCAPPSVGTPSVGTSCSASVGVGI